MEKLSTWVTTIWLLLLLFCAAEAEQDDVKLSLVNFLKKLSGNDADIERKLGWNATFDPCVHKNWTGVNCSARTNSVKSIVLEGLGLSGSMDAGLLCTARSLSVLSLRDNALSSELPVDISNCSQLTHLYLGGNRFSGSLPSSLELLNNLKRLNISYNGFSGQLPDFSKISGLLTFLAQNNSLTGTIPAFNFTNLVSFNVSYNSLRGPIPENGGLFDVDSFMGNSGLCGKPFPIACPPSPSPSPSPLTKEKGDSKNSIGYKTIMLSGYIVLAVVVLLFLSYKVIFFLYKKQKKKKKKKSEEIEGSGGDEKVASDDNSKPPSKSRSEYSLPLSGDQSAHTASTSLVVLKDSASKKELRFEELLKAPAELMGRGAFGSLYKVMLQDGSTLAVKRIKDLSISSEDFKRRMERISRAKHLNVLPPVAFYCSMQEKLVVYDYQKNGSLFKLLQGGGDQNHNFGWSFRLNMATAIAEGLSFMHEELQEEGIAHGNFKSSNILFTANMDPCISEYGVVSRPHAAAAAAADHLLFSSSSRSSGDSSEAAAPFKSDVRSFGLVLLELLTGKAAHSDGSDLARWVHSVVREEWTVEVFDKPLLADGASEEGMVHLLQVALKCTNSATDARPTMREVASMVHAVKEEEEERSVVSEEG